MTECNNDSVRDLLPDYVAGTLPVAEQAAVDAHVASCAECRNETALLRVVRSVRPRAMDIDVARIVAALPRRTSAPALRLVRDEPSAPTRAVPVPPVEGSVVELRSRQRPAQRPAQRAARSRAWQVAAAIGVMVIGSWSVLSVRDGSGDSGSDLRVASGSTSWEGLARGETLASRATFGDSGPAGALIDLSPLSRPGAANAADAGLSLGDLSEYSDEDLQRMLERLEKWDGATSTDPLPTLPILAATRGTL